MAIHDYNNPQHFMEKPRDEIRSVMHECFNKVDRIMAKSTWLEGEVPSKDDLRKIVVKALDIENLKASEEIMKNFPMTVLEICNGADEIVDNIHALLKRKLTVK